MVQRQWLLTLVSHIDEGALGWSRQRCISAMSANLPLSTPPGVASTCEIGSHADMCCMAPNFVPLHFTAPIYTPICMMCPLLEVQCISNWTTDLDLYLGVNQELWFGKELEI